VITVTKTSSTSWETVVGLALLLAGAAAALVASRKEFALLKKKMDLYGRVVAYFGALLAYIGVLTELSSGLRTLRFITASALILFLLAILATSVTLRHRARFNDQNGVQEHPKPQAKGRQQVMRSVDTDGKGANNPEESAADGSVPEPSGR
jgi:hypothetical protein